MNEMVLTGIIIGIIAIMTGISRGLPYVVFGNRELPEIVNYLGNVLPASIMAILVIYCVRNTEFCTYPYGMAEIISLLLVVIIQIWKKSSFLSIVIGTVCYMILIRTVFPILN